MYLTNMLQQLDQKPGQIEKRIGDSLVLIQNEQNEEARIYVSGSPYHHRYYRRCCCNDVTECDT